MKFGPHTKKSSYPAGFTLVEVLISLVIIGVGLLVLANFQGRLTSGSADAKARSEAIQFAQMEMEALRQEIWGMDPSTWEVDAAGNRFVEGGRLEDGVNSTYTLGWALRSTDDGRLFTATVTVAWVPIRPEFNEDGNPIGESVEIASLVAVGGYPGRVDPPSSGGNDGDFGPRLRAPTGGASLDIGKYKDLDEGDLPAGEGESWARIDGWGEDDIGVNVIVRQIAMPDGDVIREIVDLRTGDSLTLFEGFVPVRISGRVYSTSSFSDPDDWFVAGSAFALCPRTMPAATEGSHRYFDYSCFVAASTSDIGDAFTTFGWRGNLALLNPDAHQNDRVCVGTHNPGEVGTLAFPLNPKIQVRRYVGYRCEDGTGLIDQPPCRLTPVGFNEADLDGGGATKVSLDEEVVAYEYGPHSFFLARITGGTSCANLMANVGSAEVYFGASNPADVFCYGPECPDLQNPIGLPTGCPVPGEECEGAPASAPYGPADRYLTTVDGKWVFIGPAEIAANRADAINTCVDKGADESGSPYAWAWALGSSEDLSIHVNPFAAAIGLPTGNNDKHWTNDPTFTQGGNVNGRTVRFRTNQATGQVSAERETSQHLVRCLLRMDPYVLPGD